VLPRRPVSCGAALSATTQRRTRSPLWGSRSGSFLRSLNPGGPAGSPPGVPGSKKKGSKIPNKIGVKYMLWPSAGPEETGLFGSGRRPEHVFYPVFIGNFSTHFFWLPGTLLRGVPPNLLGWVPAGPPGFTKHPGPVHHPLPAGLERPHRRPGCCGASPIFFADHHGQVFRSDICCV